MLWVLKRNVSMRRFFWAPSRHLTSFVFQLWITVLVSVCHLQVARDFLSNKVMSFCYLIGDQPDEWLSVFPGEWLSALAFHQLVNYLDLDQGSVVPACASATTHHGFHCCRWKLGHKFRPRIPQGSCTCMIEGWLIKICDACTCEQRLAQIIW